MQLTEDQGNALQQIREFLADPEEDWMTLGGHAGTGKTTLLRFVIQEYLERVEQGADGSPFETPAYGRNPAILTAPTNKATKVLRSTLAEADIKAPCFTIHKANGLALADDKEEKYLVRREDGGNELGGVELLIVDEASMIGESLFELIADRVCGRGIKVLFSGDPYQLPPVKDGKAQAFDSERVPRQVWLREIVRQASDNPIIALGDYFRRRIDGENPRLPTKSNPATDDEGVFYLPAGPFYARMLEDVKANHEDNPGMFRGVAWRNVTVNDLARRAREAIYGVDVPRFVEGERVFTAKPFGEMHTDQEATVVQVHETQPHPGFPEFLAIPVEIKTDSGLLQIGFSPVDSEAVAGEEGRLRKAAYKAQAKARKSGAWGDKDRERAAWKRMHAFIDSFVDLRSVHAITTHRSQGSTFDSVYVDAQDIRHAGRGRETFKFRLLYVAVTRARRRVYIRES